MPEPTNIVIRSTAGTCHSGAGHAALLEGRFADCEAALAEAEALGESSENCRMLTATQRWCLCAEMGDRSALEMLLGTLDDFELDAMWMQATRGLVAAQFGKIDEAVTCLDAVMPRLPALRRDSEWLAVLAQIAEAVTLVGGHPVAARAYDALAPYAHRYVVEGIGAAVRGPVHRHLGLLASTRGDDVVAGRHFEAALTMSRAIGAAQLVKRIELEAAHRGAPGGTRTVEQEFRVDGETWLVRFAGHEARLRPSKGLHDIAVLLGKPGHEVAAIDLVGAVAGGDAGPQIDAAARRGVPRSTRRARSRRGAGRRDG